MEESNKTGIARLRACIIIYNHLRDNPNKVCSVSHLAKITCSTPRSVRRYVEHLKEIDDKLQSIRGRDGGIVYKI